jgi:hypothetical protein
VQLNSANQKLPIGKNFIFKSEATMSEIEFLVAKNSELVFKVAGRHLASAFNPTKEAHGWINHHQEIWRDCETIIVLGVGCGYHLRALKSASGAKILALDRDKKIIQAALRIHPLELSESEVAVLAPLTEISAHPAFIQATRGSYAVLVHEASAFVRPELYQSAKDFLLGRTAEGLRWVLQNRGQKVGDLPVQADLYSLKNLDFILKKQIEGELPLWPLAHAVRELII